MTLLRKHHRRGTSFGLLLAMLSTLIVLVQAPAAQAAWAAPSFVRSIGGNGRPGVFAWGLQYNPVSNEILVGDYLNYKVRRYTPEGDFIGDFFRSNNVGQPYSIAVDPNDGSIYVAELKDNPLTYAIAKYDKAGNYLFAFTPSPSPIFPLSYQVWMTVTDDGRLWVIDSHYWNDVNQFPPRVVTYVVNDGTQSASVVQAFNVNPPGLTKTPRMYGIDVGTDGTIYLSDAINSAVHEYTNDGTFIRSFGDAFLGQDNRGIAYNDATDRLYVVDAGQSDVDVFDKAGNHISSFGSEGTGPGQFAGGGRQIDLDPSGNVWIADFGNFRVQKFGPSGNFLQAVPNPERRPATGFFAEPRDVDVDPLNGDVWVADAWNQRFQRFSSGGTSLGTWGSRNLDPPYGMNYPRGIGIDPVGRRLWVASERGHRINTYNLNTMAWTGTVGAENFDDTDPGHLRWPNDIEFYGGKAFVSDRMSGRVKIFDSTPVPGFPPTFTELQSISRTNRGNAIDPATGNLYIVRTPSTSGSSGAIYKYILNGSGQYVQDTTFGAPRGWVGTYGSGDGQFQDTRDAIVIGSVLYVSDDILSRISAFDLNGNFLGRWGGYGSNPYQFKNPSGLARDAQGRLYVADAGNDRIVVYNPLVPKPASEGVRPTLTITSPANNGTVPATSLQLTGTATDNSAVGNVEVAVQDLSSGLWWNGNSSSWQSAKVYSMASWTGGPTSVSWRWFFVGVTRGVTYRAEARAMDTSNNTNATVQTRTFTIAGGSPPPDTAAPETTITNPVPGQEFGLGPITFTGAATDNVGVVGAEVAIQDTVSGMWWSGAAWVASQSWLTASLASPGATSTTWSFGWTPGAEGSYSISARTSDAVPNTDLTPASAAFTVTAVLPPDTVAPDTTISSPTNNQVFAVAPITFTGAATDNRGVTSVQVAIRNRTTLQWWNGSGWGSAFIWLNGASLGTPGGASTTWSYAWTPPGAALYAVTARAFDAAGNVDATRPWVNFQVA